MIRPNLTSQNVRDTVIALLPLILWLMLVLSLQAGSVRNIASPDSKFILLQGLRATLPLFAASLAVIIMAFKMRRQPPEKILFLGPLGLAAVYGLVGVLASTLSPDGFLALYWSAAYLSVPLVLWAIVWGPNTLDWITRVIDLNLLIIIFGAAAVFALGLIKLNFGGFILNPSSWFDCDPQAWFNVTSQYIRDTAVGRYAAIAAIIALSRIWNPRWRSIWVLIFLASLILLLYSSARTAMVGFAVAAPFVVLLSGGTRAALGSIIVVAVLVPVLWATGIHQTYLDNCIFRTNKIVGQTTGGNTVASPLPGGLNPLDTQVQVPGGTNIPGIGRVPPKFFEFTGRTKVWRQALDLFTDSPLLGYGFHADRLLLGTHAHNSLVHSLIQTGLLGAIPFMAALLLGWILLFRSLRQLNQLAVAHKILVIQIAGIFAFLSIRTVTESTGAFFGVDWIILGPLLLYVGVLDSAGARSGGP